MILIGTDTVLVIDVSLWDFFLNVPLLKEAGVKTVIVKIGSGGAVDPQFYKHAKAVVDGGLNLQVYYWDDPIIDPVHQAEWAVAEIKSPGSPITSSCGQTWSSGGRTGPCTPPPSPTRSLTATFPVLLPPI